MILIYSGDITLPSSPKGLLLEPEQSMQVVNVRYFVFIC